MIAGIRQCNSAKRHLPATGHPTDSCSPPPRLWQKNYRTLDIFPKLCLTRMLLKRTMYLIEKKQKIQRSFLQHCAHANFLREQFHYPMLLSPPSCLEFEKSHPRILFICYTWLCGTIQWILCSQSSLLWQGEVLVWACAETRCKVHWSILSE